MKQNRETFSDGENSWNVRDLWVAARPLRTTEVPVSGLAKHLKHPAWGHNLTPWDVVDHIRRVNRVEMSFPIILTPCGHICDGYHRLVRALLDQRDTIAVVRLKAMPPPRRKRQPTHGNPSV